MEQKLTFSVESREPGKFRVKVRNEGFIPVPIFVNSLNLGNFELKRKKRGQSEILVLKERLDVKAAWKTRQTQFNPGASALLEVTYSSHLEVDPLCVSIEFWDGGLLHLGGGYDYKRTFTLTQTLAAHGTAWKTHEGEIKFS